MFILPGGSTSGERAAGGGGGGGSGGLPDNFGVRGGFVLNESYVPSADDNISAMSSTFKKISLSRSTLLEGLRIRVRSRKRDGSTNSLRSDSTTMSSGGGTAIGNPLFHLLQNDYSNNCSYGKVCTIQYLVLISRKFR